MKELITEQILFLILQLARMLKKSVLKEKWAEEEISGKDGSGQPGAQKSLPGWRPAWVASSRAEALQEKMVLGGQRSPGLPLLCQSSCKKHLANSGRPGDSGWHRAKRMGGQDPGVLGTR